MKEVRDLAREGNEGYRDMERDCMRFRERETDLWEFARDRESRDKRKKEKGRGRKEIDQFFLLSCFFLFLYSLSMPKTIKK